MVDIVTRRSDTMKNYYFKAFYINFVIVLFVSLINLIGGSLDYELVVLLFINSILVLAPIINKSRK